MDTILVITDGEDILCAMKDRAEAEELVLSLAEENAYFHFCNAITFWMTPEEFFNTWREYSREDMPRNNLITLNGYILDRLSNWEIQEIPVL